MNTNFLRVICILFVCLPACVKSSGEGLASAECDVSKTYIGISFSQWKTYIFTDTGITFHVSPIPYAKPWSDVLDLEYDRQGNLHGGTLSTVSIEDAKPETVVIGTVDQSCWSSLKDLLKNENIKVKVTEKK